MKCGRSHWNVGETLFKNGCESVASVEQRVRRSHTRACPDRSHCQTVLSPQSVVFMALAKANRTQQNALKLPGDVFHNWHNATECPVVDHSRQSSVIPQRFSLINLALRQFVWSSLVWRRIVRYRLVEALPVSSGDNALANPDTVNSMRCACVTEPASFLCPPTIFRLILFICLNKKIFADWDQSSYVRLIVCWRCVCVLPWSSFRFGYPHHVLL